MTDNDLTNFTPAALARTTPHSLRDWFEAYQRAGHRSDWPQIAQALVDLRLHPSAVVWLATDVDAEEELKVIAQTYVGRYMRLGTEIRAVGQAVVDSFPRWLRSRRRP